MVFPSSFGRDTFCLLSKYCIVSACGACDIRVTKMLGAME